MEESCGEFGAGAAERVAERDGSAVDVDAGGVEIESARMTARACAAKASLSSMRPMSLRVRPAQLQRLGDGGDGADAHLLRQAAGDGVGDEAGEGVKAEFARAARIP